MSSDPVARKARVLGADHRQFLATFFAAALLLWPLLVFGKPAYFADSASYYNGGRTAVTIALDQLNVLAAVAAPQAYTGTSDAIERVLNAKGSRSVVYSVAAYLLSKPGVSLGLLAVAHALATGWVIAIAGRLAGIGSWVGFGALVALVALATPAAVFVCYIVPDIFAGLLIAAMTMLAVAFDRLSQFLKASLVAIAAFAVTSHASHPPLAAGLLLLGGGLVLWRVTARRAAARRIAWLAAPLVLGIAATMVTGFIGFGTMSLAPKRFPLTLARSIEDGPARWYLAEHCGERRYAVCEIFGSRMPTTVPDFLWENGLTGRATPEQMERVRAEEGEIVAAAARAYPLAQAKIVADNIFAQVTRIGLREVDFDQRLAPASHGFLQAIETGVRRRTALDWIEWLSAIAAIAATIGLAIATPRLRACQRDAATMLVAGLLGNAAICAVFSGVADRYQARVVWLLPLFAAALLIAAIERGRAAPLRIPNARP